MRILQPLLLAIMFSSCASKHYYDAQLYKPGSQSSDTYEVVKDGAIYLDKPKSSKKTISVELSEIYLGLLQREYYEGSNKRYRPDIYKGQQIWVVGKAETIDQTSALLPAETKHIGFTSIKVNQSPYNTIPISKNESNLFDLPAGRDYLITFKVYEIDALQLKKFIYSQRDSDLAQWLVASTWGAIKLSSNILAKSIVSSSQQIQSSQIEEVLLAAKSDLEFKGQFYLLHGGDTAKKEGIYALSDVIKASYDNDGDYIADENIKDGIDLNPVNRKQYLEGLEKYRYKSSSQNLTRPDYKYKKDDDKVNFDKSYIKFNVKTNP